MQDAYSILGITFSSSIEEARIAYRKLAQKHHPDKGGDAEKFKVIKGAWEDIESGRATPPQPPQPKPETTRSSFSDSGWSSKPEPAWKGFYDPKSKASNAFKTAKPKIQPLAPRVVEAYKTPDPRTNLCDFDARVSLAEAYRGFICEIEHGGKKYRVTIPPGVPHGLRFSVQVEDKTNITVVIRINQNYYSFLNVETAVYESTFVDGESTKVYRTKDLSMAYEIPVKKLSSKNPVSIVDFLGETFTFRPCDAGLNYIVRVKGKGYVDWYPSHSRAGTNRGDVLIRLVPTEKIEPTNIETW